MSRASNADIAVFDLNSGDYLNYLKSANFDWDITLVACSGIAARYDDAVETKRAFTFSAEMNRMASSSAACQTAKQVTTLSFGGTSYLASWESVDISYSNANSRSDAGGDALAQVQLHRPTTVSGSITLMVDQTTATWLTTLIDSGNAVDATFSVVDGAGTFTVATFLKKVTKQWPESGIIMVTLAFEMGTVSSGGGGLFATGCTGTGAVAFGASDGADPIEGTSVILNGRLRIARDNRTTESYDFHVNSIAVPA